MGGRYINEDGTGTKLEARGIVVIVAAPCPGVQLPALSILDVGDKIHLYEEYSVKSGRHRVVGFRFNVQTAYNGIFKALKENGEAHPGQCIKGHAADLRAMVMVRKEGQDFLTVSDSPKEHNPTAHKNLPPFDSGLAKTDDNPNIDWKTS
jgi:hypothetical protein